MKGQAEMARRELERVAECARSVIGFTLGGSRLSLVTEPKEGWSISKSNPQTLPREQALPVRIGWRETNTSHQEAKSGLKKDFKGEAVKKPGAY